MSIRGRLVRRTNKRDNQRRWRRRTRLRRDSQMRFMFIVKSDHAAQPSPALMEAMHKLATREIAAGRMLDDGGLMPVAMGTRVNLVDGRLSVVDGPFAEAKEVIGGFAI